MSPSYNTSRSRTTGSPAKVESYRLKWSNLWIARVHELEGKEKREEHMKRKGEEEVSKEGKRRESKVK